MAQLRRELPALRALAARLVLVGNGTPEQANRFATDVGLESEVSLLVDPSLSAYGAAGLTRGWGAVLDPRVAGAAARALARGHLQGRTQGDARQLGGTFVIGRGGALVFSFVSRYAGERPELARVVSALRDAGAP